MKRKIHKILTSAMVFVLAAGLGFGQLNQIDFLKGGVDDAELLFQEYVTPWANAMGSSLNGGWYNTAKPHALGGFDITFTINTTFVPDAAKSFDLSKINFSELDLADPNDKIASTIAGAKGTGPALEKSISGNPLISFNSPGGTNIGFIPLPMIQGSVGLPKNTEIVGRYFPTVNIFDAGSIGLWGVGLKHSLKQWLPGGKLIPLQISLFGGYTKLTSMADVNFPPTAYSGATVTTTQTFEGQEVRMDVSAWTVNLLISKSIPVLTVYGGAGYSATNTNLSLNGNFPIASINTDDILNPYVQVSDNDVYVDPIDMKIKNFSGVRLNAGLRIKLAVITFHFDYTYADYSVYTGGIGISFR